jgi:hypothetical protein
MRTTPELVAGIIEVDSSIPLAPFISVASSLVTEFCSDKGYDDERLELIERWLSAHFYTNRDPRTTRAEAGSVSESYQSKVDLYLATSHYGQTAMMLDTSGSLLGLSKGVKRQVVGVSWVGTERGGWWWGDERGVW